MNGTERALALKCWTAPSNPRPLEGGITNENILITDEGRDYVVRIGGDIPEHLVMRWSEVAVSQAAHAASIGPAVHHQEPGVLVINYIDSAALTEEDLHDANTLIETTDLVRKLHHDGQRQLRGPVLTFWVFYILREYAGTLHRLGSPHAATLDRLLSIASTLEQATGPVTLVLGHNDLLPANILRAPNRLWLIDFEYAGFNTPLFDLGGLATNAGLDHDAEHMMLTRYFGEVPGPDLWRSYDAMKCASLLRETMWSMVSELTSKIDYHYGDYTAMNLDRFETAYAKFLKEYR